VFGGTFGSRTDNFSRFARPVDRSHEAGKIRDSTGQSFGFAAGFEWHFACEVPVVVGLLHPPFSGVDVKLA
jgi:hypothetical protein